MAVHQSSLATISQALHKTLTEQYGLDADALYRRCGLDPRDRFNAEARYPQYAINRLWRMAIHETHNPMLPYKVFPNVQPRMMHAIGHAWIASRTLLEALQRFVRYHKMLSTNVDVRLEEAQGSYQLVLNLADPMEGYNQDGLLGFTLHMCRLAYGDDLCPLQVQTSRMEPLDDKILKEFYRCEVMYGAAQNVLIFSSIDLNRRLSGANAAVAAAMDDVIVSYLSRFDANDVVAKVRKFVAETMIHGEPTKDGIAEALGMSSRTLQRRLDEEETSVKDILDETRHQLALDYLDQPGFAIKEVAYALGFSDPSNFARAFKRWTGQTPRQYRKAA